MMGGPWNPQACRWIGGPYDGVWLTVPWGAMQVAVAETTDQARFARPGGVEPCEPVKITTRVCPIINGRIYWDDPRKESKP